MKIEIPKGCEFVEAKVVDGEVVLEFKQKNLMGDNLVGLLCGFSDITQDDAEREACSLSNISICFDYDAVENCYHSGFGDTHCYAAPIPKGILNGMLSKLDLATNKTQKEL